MNAKQIFFLLGLMVAAVVTAEAAGLPLPVAVYEFNGHVNRKKVTALITASLASRTNLVMLERSELNQALREQAFGVSGLVNPDAAAEIGQITGATVLVSGEVMTTRPNHLVIVADIIGTGTGRLFADKVEGAADKLMDLTSELSLKIEQTIADHAADFVTAAQESRDARLDRIINGIQGTNRPSVSIKIFWPGTRSRYNATTEWELGIVLLKAGFPVVDERSEIKPDIEISGVGDHTEGPLHGGLFSNRAVIQLKVQERRTGEILVLDRQESIATGLTSGKADRLAQVQAVDALAERILPLLAK